MRVVSAVITASDEVVCLECAATYYPRQPFCSACGAHPARGWHALSKAHKGCAEHGTFVAHDEVGKLEPVRLEPSAIVTCSLCEELIEPELPAHDQGEGETVEQERLPMMFGGLVDGEVA